MSNTLFTAVDDSETPSNPPALFETLSGILLRPRQTFERLRDAGRGHWWFVLLLCIVTLGFMLIVSGSNSLPAMQDAIASEGAGMPEGAADIPQGFLLLGIVFGSIAFQKTFWTKP